MAMLHNVVGAQRRSEAQTGCRLLVVHLQVFDTISTESSFYGDKLEVGELVFVGALNDAICAKKSCI